MDKKARQRLIRSIINKEAIQNQEELLQKIASVGIVATQATISRDLKELGMIKRHLPGAGYRYVPNTSHPGQDGGIRAAGVKSIEFTGSLAVIKTLPGYAGAVASHIDASPLKEIAGSIAGDDTVILAIRSRFGQEEVTAALSSIIPGIEEKSLSL